VDRRSFFALPLAAAAAALTACTPGDGSNAEERRVPAKAAGARKGIGLSLTKKYRLKQLNLLDVNWFYTWGATYPAARPAADFVPMIWGRESLRQNSVEEILSELSLTNAKELLGFNEPDHEGQADMSPSNAIKYWPQLEESGLRLGSPAPVQALGDWLKEFMDQAAAKDLRVDFVNMHSYTPPNAESFLKNVEKLHERYGKPIWITEYAVADWDATKSSPSRFTESEILDFMRETAAGLREMPFVERFAWKTRSHDDPIMGASGLFREDGSLSPTGELYQSL
jgi:hypothetical protein